MIKKILGWLERNDMFSLMIAILIAVFIFYISSIPASGFPSGLGIKTKIYHFLIFFLFCIFIIISIVKGKKENINLVYLAVLISISYAIIDETHQLFVPGRHSDILDVIIDSLGIFMAGIIYAISRNFTQHQGVF